LVGPPLRTVVMLVRLSILSADGVGHCHRGGSRGCEPDALSWPRWACRL